MIENHLILEDSPTLKGSLRFDAILLGFYYILAPFEQILNFGQGTVLKYIAALFVIIMLVRLLTTNQRLNFKDPVIFSILLLIVISFLSIFWTVDIITTMNLNITNLFLQILFIFVYIKKFSNQDQLFVKWAILLGGIATVIYSLILSPGSIYGIYGARETLTDTDPNEFAALLILPLFVAFGEFINSKKIFFMGIFFFLLFLILLTGSRGALIAVLFATSYYFVKNIRLKSIIVILLIALFLYFIVLPFLPEIITQRLWGKGAYTDDFNIKDTRVEIWATLFKNIFPNLPIWGSGTGSGGILLSKFFYVVKGVHNTYFSLIIDYGILGLPIFLYFLLNIFKIVRNEKNYAKICSFIAILIVIFFLDAYFKKYLWNILMYCVISAGAVNALQTKNKAIN